MWRQAQDLPEDLVFHVNYLGGDMPTFTLNFSRPGNQIIGQYYNFLRLGRSGYRKVMESLRDLAIHTSGRVAALGPFELISDGSAIPVFSFRLVNSAPYTVFDVSERLRTEGWQVPAYTMPEAATDEAIMRVVIREGFSYDLADDLLAALRSATDYLTANPPRISTAPHGFSHT